MKKSIADKISEYVTPPTTRNNIVKNGKSIEINKSFIYSVIFNLLYKINPKNKTTITGTNSILFETEKLADNAAK